MDQVKRAVFTTGAVCLLLVGMPAYAGDDPEWNVEAGFLTGYHDNYFYRDSDESTPDETFLTVYGEGEATFDVGPGDLTVLGGGSGAFGLDLSDTNYQYLHAGTEYKQGKTKVELEYARTFDKVFGEEDDASLYDVDAGEVSIRRQFGDSIRAKASFDIQHWNFGSPDNDRDAMKYDVEGLLRWEIWKWLAVRSSFRWTFKDADAGRYDYDGPGVMLAAELKPADPVNVFIRYRRRWRSYDGADSGDSNFNRDDTIDDVLANARWKVFGPFGLQLSGTYRHGDSDRSDRNYDAFSVTGGFFLTIGSDS